MFDFDVPQENSAHASAIWPTHTQRAIDSMLLFILVGGPFRTEDEARRLEKIRAENDELRVRLSNLDAEAAWWVNAQPWRRWGETPSTSRRTMLSSFGLALSLVVVVAWLIQMHLEHMR